MTAESPQQQSALIDLYRGAALTVLSKAAEMLDADEPAEFAGSVQGVDLAWDMDESEDAPGSLDVLLMEIVPSDKDPDGYELVAMAFIRKTDDNEFYYAPFMDEDSLLSEGARKLMDSMERALGVHEEAQAKRAEWIKPPARKRKKPRGND